MKEIISQFISEVNAKNQNEPEFMQAVTEVAENVIPYIVKNDIYYGQNILLRIAEIIGEDKLENLGSETLNFILITLNQLDLDIIRDKIILKTLPIRV